MIGRVRGWFRRLFWSGRLRLDPAIRDMLPVLYMFNDEQLDTLERSLAPGQPSVKLFIEKIRIERRLAAEGQRRAAERAAQARASVSEETIEGVRGALRPPLPPGAVYCRQCMGMGKVLLGYEATETGPVATYDPCTGPCEGHGWHYPG